MARFFAFFHALSFELNFYFDQRFPLISCISGQVNVSHVGCQSVLYSG